MEDLVAEHAREVDDRLQEILTTLLEDIVNAFEGVAATTSEIGEDDTPF